MESLLQMGCLRILHAGNPTICAITPEGEDALFEYQRTQDEMREQAAKRRADEDKRIRERLADKRHDWAIAIFSALGGSAITLFIEHVITPLFH